MSNKIYAVIAVIVALAAGVCVGYAIPDSEDADQQITNTEKALAVIGSFATGDTGPAMDYMAEGYIQHNPDYETGRDAFIASVEYLGSAPVPTTVENVRAFEDGNYVFLQTIYNFAGAGEQVGFDIFRFEGGLIAEHWDNLAAVADPNPSGRTQTDGYTAVEDTEITEQDRNLVIRFLQDVMMGNDLGNMASYFDGNTYIQHNSGIADGVDSLTAALGDMAASGQEMRYDKVHMVLACGNFVLAVSEGNMGPIGADATTCFYDLWRIDDGKIVEHWDVVSEIPEDSANDNGKF